MPLKLNKKLCFNFLYCHCNLTFTVVALFDDSPQLKEVRHDMLHNAIYTAYCKPNTETKDTHKASTYFTERRPFVCGFMEVMCVIEVVAQFGTYRHSPHEVRGHFFTADLSLPAQEKIPECDT